MARIRTIKPQHWSDKELSKICLHAHLLWIGLWNFSDDEGVFENDHLLIRSQIFPRRTDVRMEQVSQWIDQLVTARFIVPFTHDGIGYYLHRTFKTHQKIDRPQPSKIPADVIRRIIAEHSTNDRPCIVEEGISKGGERAPPGEHAGIVVYNAEEVILANQIQFQSIVTKVGVSEQTARDSLHKYHLFLEEKEQYPKGKKAVFAGFEKWLMNEKKFAGKANNETQSSGPSSKELKGSRILNQVHGPDEPK